MPIRLTICLIAGGALLLVGIVLSYILLPEWLTNELSFVHSRDYFDFLAATRSSLASVLGSIVTSISALAAIGAFYSAYRTYAATKDRNVAEVIAKGTELLGSNAMSSRLGGIYAPKRLAWTSEADYVPIMEILTGFLRLHCGSRLSPEKTELANSVTAVEIQAIILKTAVRRWNRSAYRCCQAPCPAEIAERRR